MRDFSHNMRKIYFMSIFFFGKKIMEKTLHRSFDDLRFCEHSSNAILYQVLVILAMLYNSFQSGIDSPLEQRKYLRKHLHQIEKQSIFLI